MNYWMVFNVLGLVLQFQAVFLLLPCVVSGIYREHEGFSFLIVALACAAAGTLLRRIKTQNKQIYAREGLVIVALAWIVLSFTGAVPFVLSREIPSFTNAFFETVSGFTTTGASILIEVDEMSKCCLFWRSFTHWVGGMGVIVFIVAILPMTGGQNMHLIRAESPGPSVGKLVPKARESARILYIIYLALTVLQILLLLAAGMPLFDAVTIAFGSAGTGGFAVRSSGVASYTPLMQMIIALFVILFGINFNFYFYLRGKHKKDAFKISEVRWYLTIIAASVAIITWNIRGLYQHIGDALHHALFQVASIMTTTGFASADFNLWPVLSKSVLILLMFIGACAGSTGGGLKVSRVLILFKSIRKEIEHIIHPRSVRAVMMDGRSVPQEMADGVKTYLATYAVLFAVSCVLVAGFEMTDFETVFTSVAATINNIGPGIGGVGPMANYAWLSLPSKWVLIFDMLAGRLELYPMLILLTPELWRQK
ncbi:MAG: TrkH family potassium uptake protein [Lachnospiraceae bacterium]|nr:TrkH family potassium uptake protein [Lachnospiraceae bacterium]